MAGEGIERGTPGRPVHPLLIALIVAIVFAVYWTTSFILQANGAATRFGADTWFYTELADGKALVRLHESELLGRVFRFHPLTVFGATLWMNVFGWLKPWLAQEQILRAAFALTGALGSYAAMSGFAAVMRARHVAFWGLIYAASLGIWYFSSIEESKIVSATLATLYIALYLHLRENWTERGALLLTVVLFLACLNEILAGLLVAIPVIDTAIRHGIGVSRMRWIVLHALAGPLALIILEFIARGRFDAAKENPEGATHFSMLLYYVTKNDFALSKVYAFVSRWFFFNIAAPEPGVHNANPAIGYGGDFNVTLLGYFTSFAAGAAFLLMLALIAASLWPRFRAQMTRGTAAIMLGLAAYILLRGAFFFIFLPSEALLFASSVSFAVLLLVAIPFSASEFPRKRVLLALFVTALFLANGAFMLAPQP